VEWEASAIEFLLDRGFSPEMGARPLKRAIDQLLLAPLAATMVEHRFPKGDQFLFVRSNGKEIEVEFVDPDGGEAESALPEAGGDADEDRASLASIVLQQTGSAAERASLTAHWREIETDMAGESWNAANEQLAAAMADPALWSREDRHHLFSRLELADRLKEAARTAERLFRRYQSVGQGPARASRELAVRLALQLHNLRQGLDDQKADAPIDALLRVDPAMEGADTESASDWCARLIGMYRAWAGKRRMLIEEIVSHDGKQAPTLHVTGFGAFRTLAKEIGLHVLEDPARATARRAVARVTVSGGPDKGLPKGGGFDLAAQCLGMVPVANTIIRRYRAGPSPTVRDMVDGWRNGKFDAVLGGDFDLMSAVASRRSAA
jgi:ATP-dependent Clp protease ATP-binding subunit ClpC